MADLQGELFKKHEDPEEVWKELMKEAWACKRTWGMGFPVISTELLRKYWKRVTGHMPADYKEREK